MRGWWPLLLGLLFGSACASSQGGNRHSIGQRERLMVFLPPWSEPALRPLIYELSQTFALAPVASWKLESLDEACVVFEILDRTQSPRTLAARIGLDPRLRAASAVETFTTLEEPYRSLQHHLDELEITGAHRLASGRGVRVAIVDTGVDFDHPDLRGRVVEARNFVEAPRGDGFTSDRHGTAVAGVIGAARNGEGGLGVAPEAELLALKACWHDRPGEPAACRSDSLALALDHALVARVRVVNLALTGPADPGLARLLTAALGRGVVVVAAADPHQAGLGFPASHPGVLAVSGRGGGAALEAPAVDVLTTVSGGRYDFVSGSSMAAAAASGVVALILERDPDAGPAEVLELLVRTARSDGPQRHNPGAIDAAAAVAAAGDRRRR